MNPIFSFSVKNEEDKKLVEELKLQNARSGRSFSWLVVQALKAYAQKEREGGVNESGQ